MRLASLGGVNKKIGLGLFPRLIRRTNTTLLSYSAATVCDGEGCDRSEGQLPMLEPA